MKTVADDWDRESGKARSSQEALTAVCGGGRGEEVGREESFRQTP